MTFLAAALIALCSPSSLPAFQPATEARFVPATALCLSKEPQETNSPISAYAERERMASDLEQFRGGSAGLVVLIVVLVAVIVLVAIIIPW